MPALKLFVSHSSRLDDVEHKYTSNDRNWKLLADTCEAIKKHYGNRVEVLVDKDGLLPGDKWNDCLNIWLAECHAAIILLSKRALEKSAWVAKEATILSWRAELDESFILIPVLLAGETKPEDLDKGFLGELKINRNQCISAVQNATEIVNGIVRKLGEPDFLAGEYSQTPLEILQGGIAELISDATEASICKAIEKVGCAKPNPPPGNKKGYASLLARHFLQQAPEPVGNCFRIFKDALSQLTPAPTYDRAKELFKYIRPFWVEPADVALLRLAKQRGYAVALNGQLINWNDEELKTSCYTLERYIERAWPAPESDQFLAVPLTEPKPAAEIKVEIRRKILGGGPLPPGPNPEVTQDRAINRDPRTIVLLVLAHADKGGLPDPTLTEDLITLFKVYEKLLLVFDVGIERPVLPRSIKAGQERLDDPNALSIFLSNEYDALYDERTTKTFLDKKYGIGS